MNTCTQTRMRPDDYGTATLQRHDDGTVTVLHADDLIGVARELLELIELRDGLLVLDTAGTYRYRQVGQAPADARVVLFERVNA